ncbi:MAG: DNA adenine methylase [Spirochaetota bacterium]|jgi:adenine-specific DNA-methyltransferase|nr:DNA adenine methylase [Spirochaetota bacterium]
MQAQTQSVRTTFSARRTTMQISGEAAHSHHASVCASPAAIPDNPYLSSQLIAYIGNKRRLLPLIHRAITLCGVPRPGTRSLFVDFFAGSGAVSRLAKLLGFHVIANDWEEYAWILNEAFLVTQPGDLETLFAEKGGLAEVLARLNSLDADVCRNGFISRYYAPQKTEDADPERERMFYTTENARRIDAIRAWIEYEYPGEILNERQAMEKRLLLGLLLYEAATHANTSGVFKAYHCGFGGRGGDALQRILKPVELEYPVLCAGSAEAYREDAEHFAKRFADGKRGIDIAYLDPPYNQHQYGSNYHLLNTIARGDMPKVNEKPLAKTRGSADKAGIRRDWVKTHSPFCSRRDASRAFADLLRVIRARHILISYSTEGMIPVAEMIAILGRHGRLDLVLSEYTRYRGGKQALTSTNANVEFVLIAHTEEANTEANTARVLRAIQTAQLGLYLKRVVSPAVLIARGYCVRGALCIDDGLEFVRTLASGVTLAVTVKKFKWIEACVFRRGQEELQLCAMPEPEYAEVLCEIAAITSITRDEELGVTMSRARYLLAKGNIPSLAEPLAEIPYLLKKFNESTDYSDSLKRLDEALVIALEIADTMEERPCSAGLAKKHVLFARRLQFLMDRKLALLPKKNDPDLYSLRRDLDAHSARLFP